MEDWGLKWSEDSPSEKKKALKRIGTVRYSWEELLDIKLNNQTLREALNEDAGERVKAQQVAPDTWHGEMRVVNSGVIVEVFK